MLKRLFVLLLLLALVAGGLYYWTGGELTAEGVGQALRDTATTGRVKAALELNRHLEPYSLRVSTEDGVVTLRGDVTRDDLRALAGQIAEAVPDVRQVVNHVRVSGGEPPAAGRSMGESLDDQALEVKLRMALSLHRDLEGTEIEVRSFRRQVTLSGTVRTPGQHRLAIRVAKDTGTVGGIVDELTVLQPAPPPRRQVIERALAANPQLARYGLKVDERKGRLTVSGQVRTGAERELAGRVAREHAGGPVDNAILVRR